MQAPTKAAAHSLERMVMTLAVSGSIAALARWNRATQPAKIMSGRLRNRPRNVAVGLPGCGAALPPWALSGSTWPAPMSQSDTSVGIQRAAVTKKTDWLEIKYPAAPIAPAARAAPIEANRALRQDI